MNTHATSVLACFILRVNLHHVEHGWPQHGLRHAFHQLSSLCLDHTGKVSATKIPHTYTVPKSWALWASASNGSPAHTCGLPGKLHVRADAACPCCVDLQGSLFFINTAAMEPLRPTEQKPQACDATSAGSASSLAACAPVQLQRLCLS